MGKNVVISVGDAQMYFVKEQRGENGRQSKIVFGNEKSRAGSSS